MHVEMLDGDAGEADGGALVMSIDFLVGAIRASRDLHPQVKTELEEILNGTEQVKPIAKEPVEITARYGYDCECGAPLLEGQPHCGECGRLVKWE